MSPWRKVSSKAASPVLFTKSATTIVSLSVNFALAGRTKNQTAIDATAKAAAVDPIHHLRLRGAAVTAGNVSESRFNRTRSARMSDAC